MHHPHTGQPQHIGNLVRVVKHGGGAMRHHGAGKFGGGQHAAFDVHMAVAQTGDQIVAGGVDDFGVRPGAMKGIRANIGETPHGDRHLPLRQDLAALHVDKGAAPDHQIGFGAASCHSNQMRRAVGPRFQWGNGVLHVQE